MTLVRECPTCGTSGKDKDGNRCLECGGAGKAPPDFANRFGVKHDLRYAEDMLTNAFERLPPAEALDADDVDALDKLLRRIRDLTAKIHDTLIPPKDKL